MKILLTKKGQFQLFIQRAQKIICQIPNKYAIVYIDIFKFKYINETFGHFFGDKILLQICDVLESFVSCDECYSRLYSDHFILLLKYENDKDFQERLSNLNIYLKRMVNRGNKEFNLIFRSGVYIFDNPAEDIQLAIEKANLAKCSINEVYKSTFSFYTPELTSQLEKEKEISGNMESALQQNEFEPYFQIKVDINNNKTIGSEALVRWNHGGKIIPPGDFIPCLEKNGFIIKVDMYIYESICILLRKWIDLGYNVVPISCNFSKLHIHNPNFVKELSDIADIYKIPKKYLQIEITESIPVDDWDLFILTANNLNEKGFEIALDDFGMAYSSLALISKLPVSVLKLDKIFLKDGMPKKLERDIIKMLISVLKNNGIQVVCEGIETKDHVSLLKSLGCNYAQGYYYGKPMPLSEFENLIKKTSPR